MNFFYERVKEILSITFRKNDRVTVDKKVKHLIRQVQIKKYLFSPFFANVVGQKISFLSL